MLDAIDLRWAGMCRERKNLFLFIPGFVVVLIYVRCEVIQELLINSEQISLPDAEIHAFDLSSVVKFVVTSENLFIPDAIAERWFVSRTS